MTPLLSEPGMQRLDTIVQLGMLCAFDFDGTLAPIVLRPGDASLGPGLKCSLEELSKQAATAVITGRALDDIRGRLDFEPGYIVGNHGIEGLPELEREPGEFARLCALWHDCLSQALQTPAFADPGVWIENKTFSLTVHFRLAREPEAIEARLKQLAAGFEPRPRIVSGKFVLNLLPEDAGHKGSALEHLIAASGAHSAIYVGDDVNDEDAFRLKRCDLLSIRIGEAADSAAHFYLERQEDMRILLDEINCRLRRARSLTHKQLEPVDNM